MSAFQLKKYQKKAVHNLVEDSLKSLSSSDNYPIILSGPTGCGKTGTIGGYIENITNSDLSKNFVFLSITFGDGNLHQQTYNKLKLQLPNDKFSINLLDDSFLKTTTSLLKNSITCLNWQQISNHHLKVSKKTKSKALRITDDSSGILSIIEKTKQEGKTIVILVDEFHRVYSTENSQLIYRKLNPHLTFLSSATPLDIYSPYKTFITFEEAIEAQMIKCLYHINQDIPKELDIKTLINSAIIKRDLLDESFIKEKTENISSKSPPIVPLVGIQVQNGKNGDILKNEILEHLKDKGYTIENGSVAVWLSNEKTNLDGIEKNNNPVKFLIFKQAIAQGWDCPRLYVWVKLRETKSFFFNKQVLGRFGRTPEQKFYKNKELNACYIYTDDTNYQIEEDCVELISNSHLNEAKTTFGLETNLINQTHFIKNDEEVSFKDFYNQFFKNFVSSLNIDLKNPDIEYIKNCIFSKGDGSKLIQRNAILNIKNHKNIQSEESSNFNLSNDELILKANSLINKCTSSIKIQGMSNSINLIYETLRYFIKTTSREEVSKLLLSTENAFILKLIETTALSYNKDKKEKNIIERKWSVPTGEFYNLVNFEKIDENSDLAKKYILSECILRKNRSVPEKNFEATIRENRFLKKIIWWYKNRENKDSGLSICINYNDKLSHFFPDYIFKTNENEYKVIEVKALKDMNPQDTKSKAEFMQKWSESMKKQGVLVDCAIAIEIQGVFYCNSSGVYDLNKINNNDFSDWIKLESFF